MKVLRNTLLASFLILLWSFVFSSATASMAWAQQDEVSQSQSAPPPPPQGQTYDKPDAGRPMEIPNESANGSANESANETANDLSDQSDQNDPPGRVARLQYLTGSVSIQPHGTADWVQGSVNRPLTIADNVWADKNSRAEFNVGTGLLRIGSESSLTLTNVSDNSVQLSLHQGAMNLHVRHLYRGEIYEVDTPNQAFTILKTGDYRFDVDPNADTTLVTVWRGEGESTGQGSSVRVKEHQQARFSSGNSLAHELHNAPGRDGFDDWCQVRDRREDSSISARYVSPDVIGSEDLDAYGTWRNTSEYGHVWVPTQVDREWAPYSAGHWIYQEPWGWTWDDDAPWGFAPFHYGRWVSYGGGWGWAPGPYYGGWDRGWYAPALVSWYGGGGWGVGFGVGFGFGGGFGWCPLGFGEPFLPWYHAGWGYFRNVNIYNTRINNINGFRGGFRNGFANRGGFNHANINVRGGFTAVSRGTLEHGLSVRGNAVRVNASAIRNAPALGRVSANPTMQSRLGPNAGRPAAGAPARGMSRPVISRMTPPAAARSNSFGSARLGANQSAGLQNGRGAITSRMTAGQPNSGAARPSNGQGSLASGNASLGGRFVPRPPQNFARSNNSAGANGTFSGNARGLNNSMPNRSAGSGSVQGRSVPRPPAGWAQSRASSSNIGSPNMNSSNNRGGATPQQGNSARSGAGAGGFRNSVPRPTGQVMAAPRNYSSGGNSAGRYNSARQYSGSSRYGGSAYGGRSYGGSQPSARSYSSRSYGGGGGSAPSSAGRSYGGGSYGGGRSYGGGGGNSSSSRASSGGGGSRGSSGGGSRGSNNSGGHR
jgi:FecR protein